jgi:hypothetical protein
MLTKASYIFSQASALLDDPGRTFATDEYLVPFLQLAQDELVNHVLNIPDLGQLTAKVVLANVPLGTSDLTDYFAAGQDLELLTGVITMKERPTSGSRQEQDWVRMHPVHDMPTVTPSSFNSFYQFTGDTIKMPGADQAMDLRIYGKFQTQTIVNADSPIVPGTAPILVYGTAALVSTSRGNNGMATAYNTAKMANMGSYVTNMIMEMQSVRTRMGSFSGRGLMRDN